MCNHLTPVSVVAMMSGDTPIPMIPPLWHPFCRVFDGMMGGDTMELTTWSVIYDACNGEP
jgi:hypothetical protein